MWILRACLHCHGDLFNEREETEEWKCLQCSRVYQFIGNELVFVRAEKPKVKKEVDK